MRKAIIMTGVSLLLLFLLTSAAARRESQESSGNQAVLAFTSDVGEYFGLSSNDVAFIRARRIPDEELPVVCFISKRAKVEPAALVDLRMRGRSWMDISMHYSVGPEPYYVPSKEAVGTGYEKAIGYFTAKPRKDWKKIYLADDDIVNLVNLRFITEHYRCDARDVMRMRADGMSFVEIAGQAREDLRLRQEGLSGHNHAHGYGRHKGQGS
jgi:hypothetical protein